VETSSAQNKAIVHAFVAAINTQDWPALVAVLDPAFVRHSDAAGAAGAKSAGELVAFLQGDILSRASLKHLNGKSQAVHLALPVTIVCASA